MFKSFHEMDPEVARKLIEGHENVIKPAVEQEQQALAGATCPFCRSALEARVNPKQPFINGKVLANKVLACLQCGAELDGQTRLVVKMPTASSG